MRIKNHKLLTSPEESIDYVQAGSYGKIIKPKFLIVHFTAGRSFERSLGTLTKKRPSGNVSAHLLIGRNGQITQMVPFNRAAWHAGRSEWTHDGTKYDGLNSHSIGIELENFGRLSKNSNGDWITYFNEKVPAEFVIEAGHKRTPNRIKGWNTYTSEQLEALEDVSQLIFDRYELLDVIGHDDVAPSRKTDPGPAFPMTELRSLLVGRDEILEDWNDDAPLVYLNPSTHYGSLTP
jgi:N-acetylmuramoyl-L-alanine amidase